MTIVTYCSRQVRWHSGAQTARTAYMSLCWSPASWITKECESCLGTVLFISLSCSAQFLSVLIPPTPLPIIRGNQSVMRAAMLLRFGTEWHTFSPFRWKGLGYGVNLEREEQQINWVDERNTTILLCWIYFKSFIYLMMYSRNKQARVCVCVCVFSNPCPLHFNQEINIQKENTKKGAAFGCTLHKKSNDYADCNIYKVKISLRAGSNHNLHHHINTSHASISWVKTPGWGKCLPPLKKEN